MMNFIIIAAFLALGFTAKQYNFVSDKTSHVLNQIVITICLPSVVLLRIPFIDLNTDFLLPALMPWIMFTIVAAMVVISAKLFGFSKNITGAMLMVCCFGNTSFFGFPMVNAFWGKEALVYAIVYDVLGSFLSLAVLANLIIAVYAENNATDNPSNKTLLLAIATLKRIVLFPPFIAVLVSLAIQGIHYPAFVQISLEAIALSLVPITMFIVGMHFTFKLDSEIQKPLKVVLFIKLVFTPCIVAVLVYFIWPAFIPMHYSNSLVDEVTVFESAMPPMVTTSIMAIHAGLSPKLAAASVGIGLLSSIFSLSLAYFLLSSF